MVTFATNPGSTGSINFNGTTYTNGQNVNVTFGNATAIAMASPGYHFTGWSVTGGLSTASNTTTTAVTVHGAGSLKANFAPLASSIPPFTILLTTLGMAPILLLKRRQKPR